MPNSRPNPYVGPRPYQTGEKMYGRERETRELLNLLIAERIVLLYSPSGAGKTSLIQAALFPKLREEEFVVLPTMRVNSEPPALPQLPEARRSGPIANRYVLSTLLSLEEGQPREKRLPLAQLAQMTFGDYLTRRADLADKNPVLLFDQFEEILTTAPMERDAKFAFFEQIGEALRDRSRWALFSMREDYIAGLDPFIRPLPTRFSTRYRLDLLGTDAARDAIQKPARDGGVNFTDSAAQKLINDLRQVHVQRPDGTMETQPGLYVEPVQLQVVCLRLWNNLDATDTEISDADIAQVGDVNSALASYYALRVLAVATATGESERAIREWFDRQLITDAGVRGQVLMEPERSRGLSNAAIRMLEDAHLVRADERRGATWFELAHDRLIAPVRADNAAWFEKNLLRFQRDAEEWERRGRTEHFLLDSTELATANAWAAQHANELTDVEQDFLAASEAAQRVREREQRQNRRIRKLAFGTTLLSALAVIALIVALFQFASAVSSAAAARNAQATAVANEQIANQQKQIVVAQDRVSKMTSAALAQLDVDPEVSLLLATEAYSTTHNVQTDDALRQALNASRVRGTFSGQQSSVDAVTFDPNGKFFVTGSGNGQVRLWDAANGTILREWRALDGPIWAANLNSDGSKLVTAGANGPVRVWDLTACNGNECPSRELSGHTGTVWSASFSPDGAWIATSADDQTAKIWDAATGQLRRTLTGHASVVNAAVFSPNGRYLVTASSDQTARIWDLTACADTCPFREIKGQAAFWNAAFSPDSKAIVLTSDDQNAYKYDVESGGLQNYLTGHTDAVFGAAYSPDGRYIATGSRDGTARIWDAETGQTISVLRGHTSTLWNVAFSPDSHLLLTASDDATAKLWNVGQSQDLRIFRGQLNRILGAAYSGDGKRIITVSADRTARVWDVETGNLVAPPLTGHTNWVTDGALNQDGTRAATASLDGTVMLWNLTCYPNCAPAVLVKNQGELHGVTFSPDGKFILTASEDTTAKIWDAASGALAQTLQGHSGGVNHASYSADGKQIVTASADGTARVWDAATGQEKLQLKGHTGAVNSASFNADDTLIVTASDDHTARVWNAKTGQQKLELKGHTAPVTGAVISQDGKFIVTSSSDKTARIWDAATGQEKSILRGHSDKIQTVELSPDNRYVMTSSSDKTVRIVLASIDDVFKLAQTRATRALSCDEWATILQEANYCPGGGIAQTSRALPTIAAVTRVANAATSTPNPSPTPLAATAQPSPTTIATQANAAPTAPAQQPTLAPTPTAPAQEPTLAPAAPATPALAPGVYISQITYLPLNPPNFQFKVEFINTTGTPFNTLWLVPFFEPGAKNSIGAPKGSERVIPVGASELLTESWKVGVGQCTAYTGKPVWQDQDGRQTPFLQPNGQPAAIDFQLCP